MYCDVVLKCGEDEIVLEQMIDFDYYTIRQWRNLYSRFLHYQQHVASDVCKLEFRPISTLLF